MGVDKERLFGMGDGFKRLGRWRCSRPGGEGSRPLGVRVDSAKGFRYYAQEDSFVRLNASLGFPCEICPYVRSLNDGH